MPSFDAQTVAACERLRAKELSESWASGAIEAVCTAEPAEWPLEAELDNTEICKQLTELCTAFHDWREVDEASTDGLWVTLSDAGISHRVFLGTIVHWMSFRKTQPELAVKAANTYLLLLLIPGAKAHKMLEPMVLRVVFQLLSKHWQASNDACDAPTGSKRKARSPAARRGQKKRAVRGGDADSDDDGDDSVASQATVVSLSAALALLRTAVLFLRRFPLRQSPELQEDAITALVTVSRVPGTSVVPAHLLAPNISLADLARVQEPAYLAYAGLAALASRTHGEEHNIKTILRQLLSSVLMNFGAVTSTIPKQVQNIAEAATDFICTFAGEIKFAPALRVFLQHACVAVPDRAAFRPKVAESVVRIVRKLPREARTSFFLWIYKLSRNPKGAHRIFAVDLAQLVVQSSTVAELCDHDMQEAVVPGTPGTPAPAASVAKQLLASSSPASKLLQMILHRMSDRIPSVRARAISSIVALLEFAMSSDPTSEAADPGLCTTLREFFAKNRHELEFPSPGATPSGGDRTAQKSILPVDEGLLGTLQRRTADEKSLVRKSAIQALAASLVLFPEDVSTHTLEALHKRCLDPALSVRRQALVSLTQLLKHSSRSTTMCRLWLEAALPLVMDRDDSVRTKCTEIMSELILKAVDGHDDEAAFLAWSLLEIIDGEPDMRRYLQRACSLWAGNGQLTRKLFKTVSTKIMSGNHHGGWTLLSDLISRSPGLADQKTILSLWDGRDEQNVVVLQHLLTMLGSISAKFPAEESRRLLDELRNKLASFTMPAPVVALAIQTVLRLDKALDKDSESQSLPADTRKFAGKLLAECEARLSQLVLNESTIVFPACQEKVISRYLFTLGETAMICPEKMSKRLVLILQALVTPPHDENTNIAVEGAEESGNAAPLVPAVIRAHAWLALGKLCLQDEDLAQQSVSVMARQLEESDEPAIRNNIVIILSDLCIRYTSIVERYISTMTKCLKDPSPLVRRQTLTLITRLLSETYIKLKGNIFFRLALTLIDSDENIRSLANYCVMNMLYVRNNGLFHQHFVESLFQFNNCKDHPQYNHAGMSDHNDHLFSLTGPQFRVKREFLYQLFLQNCSDLQRLQLTQSICQDILGGIVDGSLKLTSSLQDVLRDALSVLASKEIKLRSQRRGEVSDEEEDEAQENKAKATLISKIVKKNLVENIVPIIIALKNILEKQHSPLLRSLMAYLREVMRDYKEECNDIMAADRQLASEIMFDIQKFENESRRQSVASIGTPSATTPHLRSTTPVFSPLFSPALNRAPGTPKLTPPQLKKTPASTRTMSRLNKLALGHSQAANAPSSYATPKRATAVAKALESASDVPLAAPVTPHAQPLSWIRTPKDKSPEQAVSEEDGDPIIMLMSPDVAKPAQNSRKWKVSEPRATRGREKREANIDEDDDLMSESLHSTNASPMQTRRRPRVVRA
eukprot:m.83884 g.83884  ORF g.83884 m.83884 type:complete len:1438 (-) comp8320_c0_seq1:218-4531(-)